MPCDSSMRNELIDNTAKRNSLGMRDILLCRVIVYKPFLEIIMSEIIRKAHFDDAIALFFLLSMTGHDIIHDYGTGSSPIRWKQNIKLIKDFHPKEAWTGGKTENE
jgi:hypothetical protein